MSDSAPSQLKFEFAQPISLEEEQWELVRRIARHPAPAQVCFNDMARRVEALKREGRMPPLKDVLATFNRALDANFLRSVGIAPEED